MAKVNISIRDDLLKKVDEYCKSHYCSRSFFFSYAVSCYLLSCSNKEINFLKVVGNDKSS